MAFLGSLFNNLTTDPKVAQEMRLKNLINQYKKANPGKGLLEFAKENQGLIDTNTKTLNDDLVKSFVKQNNYTDLDATALKTMADNPWKDGNALKMLGGYASAHPLKTAAGVGLGAMNIGGLTDNDYYGGQIAGSLIGGLGSKFLGGGFSPMATMAGGALGSLFDKLRQKQADANQNPYQR